MYEPIRSPESMASRRVFVYLLGQQFALKRDIIFVVPVHLVDLYVLDLPILSQLRAACSYRIREL